MIMMRISLITWILFYLMFIYVICEDVATPFSSSEKGAEMSGATIVVPTGSTEPTTINVFAVLDRTAELPCDVSTPIANDKTIIVLWYRDNSGNPIFSLDLRSRSSSRKGGTGKRESQDDVSLAPSPSETDLQNRTSFKSITSPAHLQVQSVRLTDEGLYRCRVDFQKSPTRNSNVNLTVIVPPMKPTIMDEKGLELSSTIGPYNEGSNLILSCESGGGKPPPNVTWWREATLLDDGFEVTSVGIVRNDVLVPSLTRSDFRSVFRCEASNNNVTLPTYTEVTVEMNLKPVEVRILQEKKSLSAGQEFKLVCRSSGSRPPPIMAWWKGHKRMKFTDEDVSIDGNVTRSVLNFVPTAEDDGKFLSCRAENPTIPHSGMEDGWKLDIHYAPLMSLKLGRSLKEDDIKEGEDVYFECSTRANPFVHKVEWQFKGEYLEPNDDKGIVISNQSLVIQKIQLSHAGLYLCVGINTEGRGQSQSLDLQIKHIPFCKPVQNFVYGVARNEVAKITCEVIAHPKDVEFKWAFNLTGDDAANSPLPYVGAKIGGRVTNEFTKSTMLFTPHSERDYGTLSCWGKNDMGMQKSPCVYKLVAAGPPDPLRNCTVYNETETSFNVYCIPGYNGGLNQTFVLDLYNFDGNDVMSSQRRSKPEFLLNGLHAGLSFHMSVYAVNVKGRGRGSSLTARTKEITLRNSKMENIFALTPILGVLIGIVAAFTLVAIAIVIIIKVRATATSKRKEYEQEPTDRSNVPLRKDTDDGGENEEKSPDVIPCNNDHEFPSVEVKCLQKFGGGVGGGGGGGGGGTLERTKCENCHSMPPPPAYGGVGGVCGGMAVDQINHTSSWNQGKKVRPYDEMQYIEMQTPSKMLVHNNKPLPPLPPMRRTAESHVIHCSNDLSNFPMGVAATAGRRPPNYDIDDVATVETPLMKIPLDNLIPAMMITRSRAEPETTAF